MSAGAAPPPDAAVVPIPCPCHTCWRGAGRDAASPPAASCCPRRCAAPPGGERGGGRRDRPAARALKRQRHRTPSAVLRPLLVPAGTGPGSRLQAPAAMSLHSAPRPRPLSWCPPAPPPQMPAEPPKHDSHPKHSTKNPQSTPQCDTRDHFSALAWIQCPPNCPVLSPQRNHLPDVYPTSGCWDSCSQQPQHSSPEKTPMPAPLCLSLTNIFSFFSLSHITAGAILQGRVLTGIVTPETISPAWPQRAERVNCSLGKIDQTQQAGK